MEFVADYFKEPNMDKINQLPMVMVLRWAHRIAAQHKAQNKKGKAVKRNSVSTKSPERMESMFSNAFAPYMTKVS